MRNVMILLLTAVLPQLLVAQTASQNYILSRRPLNTSGTAAIETVTYVDGLGRPVETVQKGAAPDGGDIVSMKEYDGIDREVRSWLPVPVGKGGGGYVSPQAFRSSAVGSDIYGGDVSPYSENVYEQSALGRIVRRQGPGKAWRDADSHTDTEFYANRADGELQCLDYRVGDDGRLVCLGVCPAGTLYVTKTTDEDGGVSYEFTDMFGDRQLVRRHVYTASGSPLTEEYTYAYDHADRLVSTRLALNGGESRLLSAVSYDGIGSPCKTTLGNGTEAEACAFMEEICFVL